MSAEKTKSATSRKKTATPKRKQQTYPLGYTVKRFDPPKTKAQLAAIGDDDLGACDALVVMSILYPDDGSYSMLPLSRDGRTGGRLASREIFKAWMMLAKHVAEMTDLDDARRSLAGGAFDVCAEHFFGKEDVR